ncbi:MAG: NADH-quinone oxidoreductase subunit C [Actinobacteria bacterium]|nr:NADH-quinone oxidoreductase subunit C [Actinomycetota bacterium]
MFPLSSTETTAEVRDDVRAAALAEVTGALGDAVRDSLLKPGDDIWVRVDATAWRTTVETLKSLGYGYFCFLSAIDWMPSPYGKGEDDPTEPAVERDMTIRQGYAGGESRFQVFARFVKPCETVGVTIKTDVPESMSVPSISAVFAGANWHERETHEMFGISFDGHPDLRNMYLPTDFEGHPLRKDFPLLARMVKPWPGIVDVEPLPGEDSNGEDDAS